MLYEGALDNLGCSLNMFVLQFKFYFYYHYFSLFKTFKRFEVLFYKNEIFVKQR